MLRLGLILLILPSLALMGAYMYEQHLIESCTATGGFYDYALSECNPQTEQPFIPFMVRYPLLVNGGMLLSVLGLFLSIVGLYKPSRRDVA